MKTPAMRAPSSAADLRRAGFLAQDLVAVAEGLRPMCRWGLTRRDADAWSLLEAFCRRHGLAAVRHERAGAVEVSAGRDRAAIDEFERLSRGVPGRRPAPDRRAAVRRMGQLLGYPACCVEGFAATEGNGSPASFPRLVLERSAAAPRPFAWGLNFLHGFHSRGAGASGELRRLLEGGYAGMDLFLAPWIPCRFDCAPSLAYAGALAPLLRRQDPEGLSRLEAALSESVLYLDDWSFVPLAALRPRGGGWSYRGVRDARTLAPAAVLSLLASGDGLRPAPGGLRVLRGRRTLGTLPQAALLFEFSSAGEVA